MIVLLVELKAMNLSYAKRNHSLISLMNTLYINDEIFMLSFSKQGYVCTIY